MMPKGRKHNVVLCNRKEIQMWMALLEELKETLSMAFESFRKNI